jgi:MerR family transcriptional regulator/heat shock protein HspR
VTPRRSGGRGGSRRRTSAAGPATRTWQDRLDDPSEPLFTLAIAADLLGVDTQTLRRLESAAALASHRPSGNQRRYSRDDLEVLNRAIELAQSGAQGPSIARILELERQVADLSGAEHDR